MSDDLSSQEQTSEIAKSLQALVGVLKATHDMAKAIRVMKATKERLEALHEKCGRLQDSGATMFQEAMPMLNDCKKSIDEINKIGFPLQEQHKKIEDCIREIMNSGLTTDRVAELKKQLEETIGMSELYQRHLSNFLKEIGKLRELSAKAIEEFKQKSTQLYKEAESTRRWGYGKAAAMAAVAGIAAILGISILGGGALLTGAASAAITFGTTKAVSETQLSVSQLERQAKILHQVQETLQAYDTELKFLEEKVLLKGPVHLTQQLIDSMTNLLRVYSMVHEKEEDNERLRQDNIQLTDVAAAKDAKLGEKEAEIERLNRRVAKLESQPGRVPHESS